MAVAMKYGGGSAAAVNYFTSGGGSSGGLTLVTSNSLSGTSVTDTLTFTAGGLYLLFVQEWTTSNDTYRGHRVNVISAPEGTKFGTTAVAHGNAYSSTNEAGNISWPNDSTVTIRPSGSSYSLRYALYKVEM